MSQIGTLITGAGVDTVFAGQSQCDEYLVIGDVTTGDIQGLQVEIDGTPFINIRNSAPLIKAYAKWLSQTFGGTPSLVFKLATGMIKRNTTYRITNNAAATPAVFVFSDSQNGVPFVASSKGINPSSFDDFNNFSALFVTLPANLVNAEIEFADGHKATLTPIELKALYLQKYPADATTGFLEGCAVITNNDQSIRNVRLYAGATAITVLVAKLPDAAFKVLRGQ